MEKVSILKVHAVTVFARSRFLRATGMHVAGRVFVVMRDFSPNICLFVELKIKNIKIIIMHHNNRNVHIT